MIPLPTIDADPCNGCGLCCDGIGTPQGFYPAYADADLTGAAPGFTDCPDRAIWLAMPEPLRQSIRDFYSIEENWDRCDSGEPCLWFDAGSKRCGHYDHRPHACREFRPGEPDCNRMRRKAGMEPLPPVMSAQEEGDEA